MFETEDGRKAGVLDSPFAHEIQAGNVRQDRPLHPGLNSAWQEAFTAAMPADLRQLEQDQEDCPTCHQPLPSTEAPESESPQFEYDLASVPRDHSLREIADSDNLPDEVRAAILRDGKTKVWELTDQAFWIRHPDMKGKTLEKTGAKHQALREEYGVMAQQVRALIWLRQLIDELDKHRGDIPRAFLLGWMAVESDGDVTSTTSRPERGYFQIDWPGGEAREQLGLTAAQFAKLSTDRVFSLKKGVELVEKYRQFILTNFPSVPDQSELLWRLTKGRHAASGALNDTLQGLVAKKTAITWDNVSPLVPGFLRNNVDTTWTYTTKLKPFADLPGSTPPPAPTAPTTPEYYTEPSPRFEQQVPTPPPATKTKVPDTFAVPFRWICRVIIRKRGNFDSHGTGVLISDRHVLTAAHVVWDVTQDPYQYSVEVTLAQDSGKSIDTFSAARTDVPKRYSQNQSDFDYAIITLKQPVADRTYRAIGGNKLCFWGSSQCGASTTAVPVEPRNLLNQIAFTAGYPKDKGGSEMWSVSGTITFVADGTVPMHYTGSLLEGQSGSPAWINQNGTLNIIGIAVSRGTYNRIYRLSWDMLEELNTWMLLAEKTPELEYEGDQGEGPAWEAEGGGPIVLPERLEERSEELEEHQVAPKGLILLDHMHIPRTPNAATPGTFTNGSLTKLVPADMNPPFYSPGGLLMLDSTPTGLQTCLDVLIKSSFGGLLKSPTQTSPHPDDVAHVTVVDLTGHKLTAPEIAAWGAPVDMYGASVPKILALYAAFQLRSDLRDLASRTSPADGKQYEANALAEWKTKGYTTDLPDLVWLFDIRKWTPAGTLDFTAAAKDTFANIVHNCPAGELITRVSMPFIGSVAWQSGIYDRTRSGLWLRASYCNKATWASPVKTPWVHNVTALSAATYFTLLAQRRLVDTASSNDIRVALRNGCVTRLFPSLPVVASKCGWFDGWIHDCAWIQDSSVRYVVAVLSKQTKKAHEALYTQLLAQLDTLIRTNNQSPKSPCT